MKQTTNIGRRTRSNVDGLSPLIHAHTSDEVFHRAIDLKTVLFTILQSLQR